MTKAENGRTHEPSLRELTTDLDGVKSLLLEKVSGLREIIDERDRLYKERSDSQKTALEAALAAANSKNEATGMASKEAIIKAENAQTAYNVSHNDLLKKQDAMMPRTEVDRIVAGWQEKFEDMRGEIAKLREVGSEGSGERLAQERSQLRSHWNSDRIFSILMFIVALAALFLKVKP